MKVQQMPLTSSKGFFKVIEDGNELASLNYTCPSADRLMITYVGVDPELRGKGLGKEMVLAAVSYARQQKMRIVPVCSFAKRVFQQTPTIKDVLHFVY